MLTGQVGRNPAGRQATEGLCDRIVPRGGRWALSPGPLLSPALLRPEAPGILARRPLAGPPAERHHRTWGRVRLRFCLDRLRRRCPRFVASRSGSSEGRGSFTWREPEEQRTGLAGEFCVSEDSRLRPVARSAQLGRESSCGPPAFSLAPTGFFRRRETSVPVSRQRTVVTPPL